MRTRAGKTAAAMASGSTTPAPKKRSFADMIAGAPKFFREVRAEARKITWTSRKETWITSVMVGIMVVLAAGFFFVVDLLLGLGADALLRLANG